MHAATPALPTFLGASAAAGADAKVKICWTEALHLCDMQGKASEWNVFLDALPESVPSPVFWPQEQQQELLRGSKVLKEAQERAAALQMEWAAIQERVSADPSRYDPGVGGCLCLQQKCDAASQSRKLDMTAGATDCCGQQ